MKENAKTELATVGESLPDVYDVHYCNHLTKGKWARWFNAPVKDIQKCHDWIESYGHAHSVAGLVHISATHTKTTFRIVKCVRTVVEVKERNT